MVCITHKSGGCSLLLLSFRRRLLPSLTLSFFSTLIFSVLPTLTSSLWSTPAVSTTTTTTISTLTTTQSIPHTTIPPVTLTYSPTVLETSLSPQSSTYAPVTSVATMSPTSSPETSVTAPYLTPTSRSTSKTLLLLFPKTGKPAKRFGKFFNMLPSTSRSDLPSLPPSRSPLPKSSQSPHTKLGSESLTSPSPPSNPPPSLTTSILPFSTSSPPPSETALPHSSRPTQTPCKLPTSISTTSTPFSPISSSSLPTQTSSSPRPQAVASPLPKRLPPRRHARPPPPPRLPPATRPLFDRQPFIVTWNIPDLVCNRYNISLDTSTFRGVATPAKVPGQFLSLFYTDRLGLYPHVDRTGRKRLNGGIPQQGNLRASMSKARADITYYIPSRTSRGLAVVDWEEWRPLWDRNWGSKRIYQSLSIGLVLQRYPFLSARQAAALAKHHFQKASRSFMSATLSLGRAMRPNYLWGFYLFPNCYNYGWLEPGYNGRCSREVRLQNDKLLWLWETSTALFPSIYLQASLRNSHKAALMVRNRVKEALRVSSLPRRNGTAAAPVFVYARPVFIDQNRRFLSQGDLVRTIGESAAVGASGAVLWGASADYNDKTSCEALSSYLSSTLNPYVVNVTAAAQLCSDLLCQGNGRCVRKNYNSDHHLHLSPGRFRIARVRGRFLVLGRPGLADLKLFTRRFTCQCYEGLACAPRRYRELVKALAFRVKQGLYSKAQTLNNDASLNAIMEQSSFAKETVKSIDIYKG